MASQIAQASTRKSKKGTRNLPAGLALDASSGVIAGIPTTGETATLTVPVADADSRMAQRSYQWLIHGPIEITTTELPPATAGAAYEAQVAATGGTGELTLTIDGLPGGVRFLPESGWITGVFGAPGELTVVLTATDQNGVMQSRTFVRTVYPELDILTETVPDVERGRYVRFRFHAEAGGRPGYRTDRRRSRTLSGTAEATGVVEPDGESGPVGKTSLTRGASPYEPGP